MTLTAKDVADIMRLLEESTFDSLSLEMDGVKLNLRRKTHTKRTEDSAAAPLPETEAGQAHAKTKAKPPSEPGLRDVPSPLLGIFYRAPRPGEPPFIEVGSRVEEETVIGIIEVMKLMNSVRAGVKGEVMEVLAQNGAAVEYAEILLRVRPEA